MNFFLNSSCRIDSVISVDVINDEIDATTLSLCLFDYKLVSGEVIREIFASITLRARNPPNYFLWLPSFFILGYFLWSYDTVDILIRSQTFFLEKKNPFLKVSKIPFRNFELWRGRTFTSSTFLFSDPYFYWKSTSVKRYLSILL